MQAKAVTALDVWLLICVTFVAMALFEYAALLKIRFHRTRNVKVAASRKGKTARMIAEFADETLVTEAIALCATIDKMALVVFVAMFFVASFIYWLSYSLWMFCVLHLFSVRRCYYTKHFLNFTSRGIEMHEIFTHVLMLWRQFNGLNWADLFIPHFILWRRARAVEGLW